jgi:hypothetical protein
MGVEDSLLRGLQQAVRKRLEDLDDREDNFVDFQYGLDWTLGMANL